MFKKVLIVIVTIATIVGSFLVGGYVSKKMDEDKTNVVTEFIDEVKAFSNYDGKIVDYDKDEHRFTVTTNVKKTRTGYEVIKHEYYVVTDEN